MSRHIRFKFRLYIAGDTPNSARASANLHAFCRQHLADRHEIEIVDVFRHAKRALADGIFMTPTLIRLTPRPARKLIGTLSQTQVLLETLDVEASA